MKPGRENRLATWCAIFIAVISLVFSSWQGCALKSKMVEVSEVNQRTSERLDYLEASKIDDKLASPYAKTFMKKWLKCAEIEKFVYRPKASARHEIYELGRELVNTLEPEILQWFAERIDTPLGEPEPIEDVLLTVNKKEWLSSLREYNKKHDTSISLEAAMGILVAYLDPKCSQLP